MRDAAVRLLQRIFANNKWAGMARMAAGVYCGHMAMSSDSFWKMVLHGAGVAVLAAWSWWEKDRAAKKLLSVSPLPPVKDIKGNVRIEILLAVTALTLLTGCATVRGWFTSPQAHDIERTVRVDIKDIAKIVVTDGKTITTTILADAQEFATNTTEQAAVAKTIVEIAPLLK